MKTRLNQVWFLIGVTLFLGAHECLARNPEPLPYSVRTRPYSGYSSGVQGGVRIVGMGGAGSGLSDNFITALENPAALGLLTRDGDIGVMSNTIFDSEIQTFDQPTSAVNIGASLPVYPFAFAIGYRYRAHEEATYSLLPTSSSFKLELSTKEYYAAISRVFFKRKLAIGATLSYATLKESIITSATHQEQFAGSIGYTVGATYQFPKQIIASLNFLGPRTYSVSASATSSTPLTGFFQSMQVPFRVGLGLGWIPNRFFRATTIAYYIGTTANTALLRQDTTVVGTFPTLQPHFGFSYRFVDFSSIDSTLYLGTYIESLRSTGSSSRVHYTMGMQLNPWLLNFSFAVDSASGYNNYVFGAGVNVLKLAEALKFVPRQWHPPYNGFLPNPFQFSDTGLPRGINNRWRDHGSLFRPKRAPQKRLAPVREETEVFEFYQE